VPLTTDEYDELRAAGGRIYAEGCPTRPWLGDRPAGVDLATVLRQRVAVPVRVEGLPVEGAPAG
jgi:hypothetical protein